MPHPRTIALPLLLLLCPISSNAAQSAQAPGADDAPYVVMARETFEHAGVQSREAVGWIDQLGRELVVARVDALQAAQISRHVHEAEQRCGGYFAFASRAEAEGFIANSRAREGIDGRAISYTIDNQATVLDWMPQANDSNIHGTIAQLSSFTNRYYRSSFGREAAEWIRDTWQDLAAGRSDIDVQLTTPCSLCSTQPSVILTIEGAELPDEVVVVGGHLDSINSSSSNNLNQVAPGADDDASGIATITEIIRIVAASDWKPKRTVKFMGYAAEEIGLHGSTAIATEFAQAGVNVVGVLQLDMTNYKNGTPYDMQIIGDNSNTALKTFFGALFDEYLVPLGYVRTTVSCGYGCSDHASWTEKGFPAGMVFEAGKSRLSGGLGSFPYIHSVNDTLANMDDSAANSVKFAQFGLAFVGEVAKTHEPDTIDDRIFVDSFETLVR